MSDNSYFSPTTQLTFITTANCTAKCDHCVMYCVPGDKRKLTFEQMKATIDQFNSISPLFLVVFSGGEPLLLGEDLYEALAYCDSMGILTRIVTNCYWAKDDESAGKILRELRESGLWELNISCDDYHEPYVPFEYVKRAYMMSKSMGFSAVVIANSHSGKSKITPDYIKEQFGEDIYTKSDNEDDTPDNRKSADGTYYLLSNATLQNVGRARERISPDNFVTVPNQNLFTGCRWCVNHPAISPINHVWSCCGIQCDGNEVLDMGDLNKESAEDIMNRAYDNMLLVAIKKLGPMYLRELALSIEPMLKFKEEYSSVCEVCQDLTENKDAVQALKANYFNIYQAIKAVEEKKDEQ